MKIRYISDIHLEFINPNKIEKYLKRIEPNKDDIYVCAGDIGDPYKYHYDIFMKYMSKNFKKVFLGKKLTVRYLILNKYGCPTQLTAVGIRKDL